MCFYLRNWQVTFLLYTLGVKITEYIAKAPIEPRDYRVVQKKFTVDLYFIILDCRVVFNAAFLAFLS